MRAVGRVQKCIATKDQVVRREHGRARIRRRTTWGNTPAQGARAELLTGTGIWSQYGAQQCCSGVHNRDSMRVEREAEAYGAGAVAEGDEHPRTNEGVDDTAGALGRGEQGDWSPVHDNWHCNPLFSWGRENRGGEVGQRRQWKSWRGWEEMARGGWTR